jgi:enamine deaminase RidA (YjgF/YER057c/UK114 family)
LSELDVRDPEILLAELGYPLPGSAIQPYGLYAPAVQFGDVVITAGVVPVREGQLLCAGKVGSEVTVADAQEAARVSMVNALAAIRDLVGSLRRVRRVIKLNGYVNCAPGFNGQPEVMNAASQLLIDIFGETGRSARTAVGVAELPFNAAVELDVMVELR